MKDYMVAHTFKSEEMREQYFEATKDMTADDIRKNMKNENANFQMNWNNEKNDMNDIDINNKSINLSNFKSSILVPGKTINW